MIRPLSSFTLADLLLLASATVPAWRGPAILLLVAAVVGLAHVAHAAWSEG